MKLKITGSLFITGFTMFMMAIGYQNTLEEQDTAAVHEGERPPPNWEDTYVQERNKNHGLVEYKPDIVIPDPTATPIPTPTPVPPTPTPKPAPVYQQPPAQSTGNSNTSTGCRRQPGQNLDFWIAIIQQYSWDFCSALAILDCESDGSFDVYNGSGSGACGPWQHLPCQHNGDPHSSTALAWAKYSTRGWQPWTVGGCFP